MRLANPMDGIWVAILVRLAQVFGLIAQLPQAGVGGKLPTLSHKRIHVATRVAFDCPVTATHHS